MVRFVQAETEEQIHQAQELFLEYADSLNFDLCFQNFDKELAELPGEYAPPHGRLLLVFEEAQLAGCVALRRISEKVCEMKRLYVPPTVRGKGIGRALAEKIIDEAQKIGYIRMRLDTVPLMKEAIALYQSMGFKTVEPYRHNPIKGAIYMELEMKPNSR